MNLLVAGSCAIMLILSVRGLVLSIGWDPDQRHFGYCLAAWNAAAITLFFGEWLPSPRHEPYSLAAITAISFAGYLFGKALVALTRWEWVEDA